MTALAVALAVLVGVTLGLLGGGGSILTVPLLVYVAGIDTREAIATSLLVVGVTAAAGAVPHARAGRVQWRAGLLFGAAGMAGAYLGGRLAAFVPEPVLLGGFAVMMFATAVAMLRGRREGQAALAGPGGPVSATDPGGPISVARLGGPTSATGSGGPRTPGPRLPVVPVLLEGLVVGLVTGIVGAGGGFLVVPALVLLGGLPMPTAVGTSLVVIAMKSFAGLAGYLASVQVDWALAAAVTGAAVLGGLVGGSLAGRVDPDRLRRGFGWFVVLMALVVGAQEVPGHVWSAVPPAGWLGAGVGGLAVAVLAASAVRRRRPAVSRARERAGPPMLTDDATHPDCPEEAHEPDLRPPVERVAPTGAASPAELGGPPAGPGRPSAAVGTAARRPPTPAGRRGVRRRLSR